MEVETLKRGEAAESDKGQTSDTDMSRRSTEESKRLGCTKIAVHTLCYLCEQENH